MYKKSGKKCELIKGCIPGEIIRVDLLEISKRQRVIIMIDYLKDLYMQIAEQ